jgi:hypothetical protein
MEDQIPLCWRLLAILLSLLLFVSPAQSLANGPTSLVPPAAEIPTAFFGMHIHRAASTTPWPSAPVAEWRLWDAYVAWPNLQPTKNQWRFEMLDRYVALAQQHGVGLLLPLGLSPAWASARPLEKSTYQPGFAAEPRDITDWRTYVHTVAQRYKGKIEAYEIWNEPNLKQFWTGNVDQMLELTRQASEIIHSIDPHALIVSPSATQDAGTQWLAEFLAKGGGNFVDVIGYHFYVSPQPPEATVPLVAAVRHVMEKTGVGNKPLWNTEIGWSSPKPFPSQELAAAYLLRAYVMNWAAGVQRVYWYAWDNHGWVTIETTEKDNITLTPAGTAYGAASRWLAGARMRSCAAGSDQTWTCELERAGNLQRLIWSASGKKHFALPREWHIQSAECISGEKQSLNDGTLDVGDSPVLLSSKVH